MQKLITVRAFYERDGSWVTTEDEVNQYLDDGWEIKSMCPMGAFGYGYSLPGRGYEYEPQETSHSGFAALVLLQRKA